MSMQKILIVEDQPKLAQVHKEYVEQSGFDAFVLNDGDKVVSWVRANVPDLVVLDIMLPGQDGLSICKEIRQFSNVPIIMVTAKVEETDKIIGLELGADDYVSKPVGPKELVARIRANIRRSELGQVSKYVTQSYRVEDKDGISIHESKYKATINDKALDLTAIEFQLLMTLVKRPGRIMSREQIMQKIYSDRRIVSDRTIDSHIKKIRKKIADIDPDHEYIHTLYGAGFKYEKEPKKKI